MIVFDISNGIHEIQSEADDVIYRVDKLKKSFFKTAAVIVDFLSFEPKARSSLHEALAIIIERDIQFAVEVREKGDVF